MFEDKAFLNVMIQAFTDATSEEGQQEGNYASDVRDYVAGTIIACFSNLFVTAYKAPEAKKTIIQRLVELKPADSASRQRLLKFFSNDKVREFVNDIDKTLRPLVIEAIERLSTPKKIVMKSVNPTNEKPKNL